MNHKVSETTVKCVENKIINIMRDFYLSFVVDKDVIERKLNRIDFTHLTEALYDDIRNQARVEDVEMPDINLSIKHT